MEKSREEKRIYNRDLVTRSDSYATDTEKEKETSYTTFHGIYEALPSPISHLPSSNKPTTIQLGQNIASIHSSKMITLGIIGTSWITHDYVSHAQATGHFVLGAVYSRQESSARDFASKIAAPPSAQEKKDIALHTSIPALGADKNVQAVYIASPNSLHFEHAKAMLEAGKHVILEKPAACTTPQLEELFQLAYSKQLILIEAWRHVQEANFKVLKTAVGKLGTLYGASINFLQYSSKMAAVLKGETPNVFNLDFGAGALADLGCYTVAAAVELFGSPSSFTYRPVMLPTGADGGGVIVLQYSGFAATLTFSKIAGSKAVSEIFGEGGTLTVGSITDIEGVGLVDPRRKPVETVELGGQKEELNLKEEAQEHARIIEERDTAAMKRWEGFSREVLRITEGCRRENGLLFPVEREGK